jgi:hypothetical protein
VDKITDAKVNSIVIVKEGSGIVDQKAFKR